MLKSIHTISVSVSIRYRFDNDTLYRSTYKGDKSQGAIGRTNQGQIKRGESARTRHGEQTIEPRVVFTILGS